MKILKYSATKILNSLRNLIELLNKVLKYSETTQNFRVMHCENANIRFVHI